MLFIFKQREFAYVCTGNEAAVLMRINNQTLRRRGFKCSDDLFEFEQDFARQYVGAAVRITESQPGYIG